MKQTLFKLLKYPMFSKIEISQSAMFTLQIAPFARLETNYIPSYIEFPFGR